MAAGTGMTSRSSPPERKGVPMRRFRARQSPGNRLRSLLTLLLLAAALGHSPTARAGETGYAALSTEWAAQWNAGNVEAVMALYTPEPVFQPTSGERWAGSAAIRQHFSEALAKYRADLHMHSLRTGVSGRLAYDSGTYEETVTPVAGGDPALHVHGNYLFLLRRTRNGAWKILEQTWSEYVPEKL